MSARRPAPTVPEDLEAAIELLEAAPTDHVRGLAVTRLGPHRESREQATEQTPAPHQTRTQTPIPTPTVVLVHGLGASRVVWAPVVPDLARHYDLVVVDLPGHGASDPLDGTDPSCLAVGRRVAATCAELGVVRPHLIGNSLGGWIALEMAADDAAASVLALAPAGLRIRPVTPNPILRVNRALARRTAPIADALLDRSLMRRVVFATGSSNPAALHPALARGMVHALVASTAYEAMLDVCSRRRFERRSSVRVPTTVVFGDRDWILPPANQRPELAPPGVDWQRWPRCGHAPMWDQTERTLELAHRLIASASGATSPARMEHSSPAGDT